MNTRKVVQRKLAVLALAALILPGCGKVNFHSSYSTSTDWNVNGHRTITKTHDGVRRKLDSATDVEIHDGHLTKFSPAALVRLEETGGDAPRRAELREREGRLELWISVNGTFRKGGPADEAWLEHFLGDLEKK